MEILAGSGTIRTHIFWIWNPALYPLSYRPAGWHGGARTHNLLVNSQALYQLSYTPKSGGPGQNRTAAAVAFNHPLYLLSYRSEKWWREQELNLQRSETSGLQPGEPANVQSLQKRCRAGA